MSLSVDIQTRLGDFELDVSFGAEGGVISLFGASGAGKTTVLKAVAGLLTPQSGTIRLGGETLFDGQAGIERPPHRRGLGFVFQDMRLFPHMSVAQNIDFGKRYAGRAMDASARSDIIELLGIGHLLARRPARLSGGEAQRVALARALVAAPRGLLLDEPLAALDQDRRLEVLPYLETIRERFAVPILHVSHSLSEVLRLATTVVVMERGRVLQIGRPEDLLTDPDGALSGPFGSGGALLNLRVVRHIAADGLTELEGPGGPLLVPTIDANPGHWVRLRIAASDVMLASDRPERMSALNTMHCTVLSITPRGPTSCDVLLQAGQDRLLSRITRRSVRTLELAEGVSCFAVVKSVRLVDSDLGLGESFRNTAPRARPANGEITGT